MTNEEKKAIMKTYLKNCKFFGRRGSGQDFLAWIAIIMPEQFHHFQAEQEADALYDVVRVSERRH